MTCHRCEHASSSVPATSDAPCDGRGGSILDSCWGTTLPAECIAGPANMPSPPVGETNWQKSFFEDRFFKRTDVPQLLKLASTCRGGSHECQFGVRCVGTYNAVFFIKFDDSVEWVVKMPKMTIIDNEDDEYLKSEYATMAFLQRLGNLPIPTVYGACFNHKNPAKTPYIFMEKVPGVSLCKAIVDGLPTEGVKRILSQLAQFKKTLFNHPDSQICSHSCDVDPWGEMIYTAVRQYSIWTFAQGIDPSRNIVSSLAHTKRACITTATCSTTVR
jgi:hypothetical protein